MGTNYHSDWTDDSTEFLAASMNPALQDLDKGITYLKNIVIYSTADIGFVVSTGVLSWASPIVVVFTRNDGLCCVNKVEAGSITLTAGQCAYLDLNETNNTVLTMAAYAVGTGGAASNAKPVNRIVLGIKAATSGKWYPVHPAMGAVVVT